MEGGRIVESGSYRDLVAKEGSRFRALMAAQLSAVGEETGSANEEADEEDEKRQDDDVKEVKIEVVEGQTKKD
jgi:hypothetical protein